MSIKPDSWIRRMATEHRMIDPFSGNQVAQGMISFGLSSYGYDLRLATEFKIFDPPEGITINPKSIPAEYFRDYEGPTCDVPPGSYVLGKTLEYLRIPRDVLTLCVGKSTYARSGILVNVTPFEPEWEGHVTVSIANTTSRPVQVFAGEGLCQVLFFQSDETCEVSYRDRKGKYNIQQKIEISKIQS